MKKRKIIGTCAICSAEAPLTFEHIPPKSSGNNHSVKLYNGEEVITKCSTPWNFENLKFKIQQKGSGKPSLCQNCNNNTGNWYGQAYIDVSNTFIKFARDERVQPREGFNLEIPQMRPLEFLKQILSFFSSIQGSPLSKEISDFILKKEATLPDLGGFRVFMYIHVGTLHKQIGPLVEINLTEGISQVSELTSFPFGFVLYYPNSVIPKKLNGVEITHFCQLPSGEDHSVKFQGIVSLESNNIFPNDYRSKEEILADIERNQSII